LNTNYRSSPLARILSVHKLILLANFKRERNLTNKSRRLRIQREVVRFTVEHERDPIRDSRATDVLDAYYTNVPTIDRRDVDTIELAGAAMDSSAIVQCDSGSSAEWVANYGCDV
jgi:hypothetical protein